jgi:dolichol-phosphate mannosyltransferase
MRLLLFIPTLNEVGNIEPILLSIIENYPDLDILIIDDNSLDGTVASILAIKAKSKSLTLISRPGKLGIGSAHVLALNYARKNDYEFLITMDGDGAHKPELISTLLKISANYDVVIGSRYLVRNSLAEWNLFRKTLTRLIHLLTRVSLDLRYDSSSAFRCYNMARMPEILFTGLKSVGYDFFFESLFELTKYKYIKIYEIPIDLPARIYGNSKLTLILALKAGVTLFTLIKKRIIKKFNL